MPPLAGAADLDHEPDSLRARPSKVLAVQNARASRRSLASALQRLAQAAQPCRAGQARKAPLRASRPASPPSSLRSRRRPPQGRPARSAVPHCAHWPTLGLGLRWVWLLGAAKQADRLVLYVGRAALRLRAGAVPRRRRRLLLRRVSALGCAALRCCALGALPRRRRRLLLRRCSALDCAALRLRAGAVPRRRRRLLLRRCSALGCAALQLGPAGGAAA